MPAVNASRGFVSISWPSCYFFSEARAEIKPFDRFWRIMAQNAQNHARMCLFGVKIFNFNIWLLFMPQKCQILPTKHETWKSKYIRNY